MGERVKQNEGKGPWRKKEEERRGEDKNGESAIWKTGIRACRCNASHISPTLALFARKRWNDESSIFPLKSGDAVVLCDSEALEKAFEEQKYAPKLTSLLMPSVSFHKASFVLPLFFGPVSFAWCPMSSCICHQERRGRTGSRNCWWCYDRKCFLLKDLDIFTTARANLKPPPLLDLGSLARYYFYASMHGPGAVATLPRFTFSNMPLSGGRTLRCIWLVWRKT